jgi:hypothetical protein
MQMDRLLLLGPGSEIRGVLVFYPVTGRRSKEASVGAEWL